MAQRKRFERLSGECFDPVDHRDPIADQREGWTSTADEAESVAKVLEILTPDKSGVERADFRPARRSR
jgi:hypothetical protein